MSSVDTSMSSSDVSEKGPLDFAVKAVSLKPSENARILQSTGPIRTFAPPVSRHQPYPPHQPAGTASVNLSSKTVFNRVVSGSVATSTGMSSGTAVTAKAGTPLSGPVSVSTAIATSAPHSTTTYLIPRGGMQVTSNVAPRVAGGLTRATMTIQSISNSTMVRAPNHVRATSPGVQRAATPRPTPGTAKPTHVRQDLPRPIIVPAQPAGAGARPLTLTTATHQLNAPEKVMKVAGGSVAQVLPIRSPFGAVSTFVGPNQTTAILQRSDGVPSAVLGPLPVRLAPPLAPLITTQRVAVSVATVGTRLAVPASPGNQHRGSTQPVNMRGAVPSSVAHNLPKMPGPGMPPARLAYVTHTNVSRTTTQVTMTLANSKPMSTATVVTSGARMPNHQTRPGTPQGPQAGLLLHPQLVVSTSAVRPALVATSAAKVIQHSLPASIQISAASKPTPIFTSSSTITSLSSKPSDSYKVGSSVSLTRIGGPPGKTYPIGAGGQQQLQPQPPILSIPDPEQSPHQHPHPHLSTTVFIPAPAPAPGQRTNPSPGVITSQMSERRTYTLPSGAAYFYEAPSGYQLAPDAPLVARPLSPETTLPSRPHPPDGPLIAHPFTTGTIATGSQTMRYNPMMLVEAANATAAQSAQAESAATDAANAKLLASPRPSILRKRDSEGNININKVVKNLTSALSGRSRSPSPAPAAGSLHCETTPAVTATAPAAEIGPSSNGSTTMSASSSPVPEETPDPDRGPEMSPRKKPRKQLLNDANETIDMEFISEEKKKKMKKEKEAKGGGGEADAATPARTCVLKKPPTASLLRSYKHSWKARNNHFIRCTDVKPREERRPSVTELANQKQVLQRVNGWKVHHLSTQFENLAEMETGVLERLSAIFKAMDTNLGKECTKDVDRVNELIMGNIQRSKVIRDQMTETRTQLMKGFDHKVHVSEILTRCASKRNFKKRDKY